MTNKTPGHIERERIEGWLESLGNHELPDWIVQHLKLYMEDPEKGHLWDATDYGGYPDTPSLLLTTMGRNSGNEFTIPLLYGADNGNPVLVGSKGGAPEHPAWFKNLMAHQRARVQVASRTFEVTPRVTVGEERQRLWQMMVDLYPPLEGYQQHTDREIPVVVLEPVESATD
jgi:deazaflavin-dependent oxidoreductase (nitroreductase family)